MSQGKRMQMASLIGCFLAVAFPSGSGVHAQVTEANQSEIHPPEMLAASVLTKPNLVCNIHALNRGKDEGIIVYSDGDGYVRFHGLRITPENPLRQQILDCKDGSGAHTSYKVDLASDNAFIPRPLDLSRERGHDRPPLSGDPLARSTEDLIKSGYGLRPDPAANPNGYATWLAAASQPGRMLEARRTADHNHNPIITQSPQWTGSVLTGGPPYVSVQGTLNVPRAIPGGDGTTNTEVALWNGLGGFGTGSGLIQSGVTLATTPTTAAYGSWREYCCGDPNSNGYGGAFVPNPGDTIFVQNWYCDAQGNPNLAGGYGCSFLHDLNTSAILSCTLANGSPCWSVPALPLCSASPNAPNCMTLGFSAEFILEHQSNQLNPPVTAFTDFTPTVRMTGYAHSTTPSGSGVAVHSIGTDATVFLLGDFTNSGTRVDVTLGGRYSTCFTVYARHPFPNPPPKVDCPSTPLPLAIPINPNRSPELTAVILFGIIHDEGGVAIVDGKINKIPPRGPLSETLALLPAELNRQLSPLLDELPASAEGINALAAHLKSVIVAFRDDSLGRARQPVRSSSISQVPAVDAK